jgi:hypothetical protein
MKYPARLIPGLFAIGVCLTVAACGTERSSNPLSPTVAGPIAGVSITAPKPIDPSNGVELRTGTPVTLTLENASSTSERPFWHKIEVALDSGFSQTVLTADKVMPGANGRATYTVNSGLIAGRIYYWRAMALDGANSGPYSAPANFRIVDPVTIGTPAPVSPVNGETIASVIPTLVARNTANTGTPGAITYRFEVAADSGFAQLVAIWSAARSGGDTTSVTGSGLTAGATFYWRVIASDGAVSSGYSTPQSFKTPGGDTGGGGGGGTPTPPGGGGGGGGPWPTNGEAVIAWAARNYPDRLAPTSSAGRVANMAFLRDRMIEAGICGGMQLAWNLKRGGPEISTDYLVENVGGRWVGVDIAHDYDNAGKTMQLTWAPQPDDPYATYGGYSGTLPCR